jgi:hypothetical protein
MKQRVVSATSNRSVSNPNHEKYNLRAMTMHIHQKLVFTLLIALGMASAQAALVNYTITGLVLVGDETYGAGSNVFNLTANEEITAFGVIDDSVFGAGTNNATFVGSNTITIDVNGTLFTEADDAGASLTFVNGDLDDFSFIAGTFNSNFMQFNDPVSNFFLGQWNTAVVTTVIPIPAAFWLFGSGLMGLIGIARKKKV